MTLVVINGLIYGVTLSVLLGGLIVLSASLNAEIWLNDYPPDIRARYGAMREKILRQSRLVIVSLLALRVGVMAASVNQLSVWLGKRAGFWQVFLSVFLSVLVFNIFDLVVLDWLIFVRLQPRAYILPGTEGLPGYQDLNFHVRGFFTGLVICLVSGFAAAGISLLF